MGRTPKPWWWEERKGYYAFIHGSRRRLGTSLVEAKNTLKALLQQPQGRPVSYDSVAIILDDFISWCTENRKPKTARGYEDFCQSFLDSFPHLKVFDLTSANVTVWLQDQKTWNSTTKRNAITALQRAFNWAVKNRGLERNPIRGMEKPEANRRTVVLTPQEFDAIIDNTKDAAFRELLIVSYDSGARPQEIKQMEARHIQIDKFRCVIPSEEAKGRQKARVIYFPTYRCQEIIKRRVQEHPEGKIFRNHRGRDWTASAIKCRFDRMEDKVGKRYNHYAFRHTFITRKLLAGVDSHIVASLSGHSDTKMLDTVYSHVAEDYSFMLKQAKKDIG